MSKGFGAQIGFLKMQSQNLAHSQQFHYFLWKKSVKISLEIDSEWEENYSCTNAMSKPNALSRLLDIAFESNPFIFPVEADKCIRLLP
jgi:hypothetical protein